MKHLSPATALPEVHRVARREDMGQKRDGRGLDVLVHDSSTAGRVSPNPAKPIRSENLSLSRGCVPVLPWLLAASC